MSWNVPAAALSEKLIKNPSYCKLNPLVFKKAFELKDRKKFDLVRLSSNPLLTVSRKEMRFSAIDVTK